MSSPRTAIAAKFSPFYLGAFAWNLAQGTTNVLLPLYALELGYSGVGIGALLALPVVLQFAFNLAGGAYVDRIGARNMLHAACIAMVFAAVTFQLATSYAVMMSGVSLFVLSRGTFWPANYAMGSQLPGDRAQNMGWLNAVTNAGQIAGTAVGGMLIVAVGFKAAFWLTACMSLGGILLTAMLPHVPRRAARAPRGILVTYAGLARQKPMYFGIACAFLSVLPFTKIGRAHV